MLTIGNKAKINLHWKVSPYDFSKERLNSLISKVSKKYGIPKEHVRVTPEFITKTESGEKISLTSDIVSNIQDPKFQVKLFQDYLKLNNIVDYDLN